MKVGMVTGDIGLDALGGLQIRIATLVDFLARVGVDIILYQTSQGFEASKITLEELGNSIECVVSNRPSKSTSEPFRTLSRYLVDIRPDARHLDVLDVYEPLATLPSRNVTPVVYTTNNGPEYIAKNLRSAGLRQLGLHMLKSMLELRLWYEADKIVVVNSLQKRFITEILKVPADRVEIIPEGYDEQVVESCITDPDPPGELHTIAYSGRITRLKGVEDLADCFWRLRDDLDGWRLVFVGDGPAIVPIRSKYSRAFSKGRIVITGHLSRAETVREVSRADVFVLPSLIESLPISLVEAMALGKAVVSTDVGAIRTDLVDNGRTGLLIRAGNRVELTSALRLITSDRNLRARLGANARRKVLGMTTQSFLDRTLGLYRRLTRNNEGCVLLSDCCCTSTATDSPK